MILQSSITPLNSSHTTNLNNSTLRMSCDSICSENGLEFNESERVYSALPIKFLVGKLP